MRGRTGLSVYSAVVNVLYVILKRLEHNIGCLDGVIVMWSD